MTDLTPTQQKVLERLDMVEWRTISQIEHFRELPQTEAVGGLRALKRKGLAENRPSERVPGNMEWRRTR
jgi:hypothetical protein